jgi:hypothetical protein
MLESFPCLVESDPKMCVDALVDGLAASFWKIDTPCAYVNSLVPCFLSCCFTWVMREANSTAHELAFLASSLRSSLSCNAFSLPLSVFKAWQRDMLGLS